MASRDIASTATEGLGECAHPDIHIRSGKPEMFAHAIATLAHSTQGMGLIHHQKTAEFPLESNQARQIGNFTVHAKKAFRDNQSSLKGGPVLLKLTAQSGHIVIGIGKAGRPG